MTQPSADMRSTCYNAPPRYEKLDIIYSRILHVPPCHISNCILPQGQSATKFETAVEMLVHAKLGVWKSATLLVRPEVVLTTQKQH